MKLFEMIVNNRKELYKGIITAVGSLIGAVIADAIFDRKETPEEIPVTENEYFEAEPFEEPEAE